MKLFRIFKISNILSTSRLSRDLENEFIKLTN
jgi:hypothetical protein